MHIFLMLLRCRLITKICFFSFFIVSNIVPQTWHQTTVLNSGIIKTLAISPCGSSTKGAFDTNIFAGAIGGGTGGVYISTNTGSGWTQVNNGLSDIAVYALALSPGNASAAGTNTANLFAGTQENGVYLSTNNGSNWIQVNNGLTNMDVNTLTVSRNGTGGYNVFAGTWGSGIFLSTNNGSSWTQVNNGLKDLYVNTIAVSSPDSNSIGTGPIATNNTFLFAGTVEGGVYLSTNNGSSWTQVNNGLKNQSVLSIVCGPNGKSNYNLFAGTSGNGVYLSTNNGSNWTQINNGLTNQSVQSLAVSSNGESGLNLFAGTNGGGVYISTNNGSSWVQVNQGLTNLEFICRD
jgi:hypothetical protein